MLIFLMMIIFTVLTFYGFMFIKNKAASWAVGGLSILILTLSIAMLTFHIKDNWGMKEVTTSTSHSIYSAGDTSAAYGMMIKAEIGENTGNYVLIYRNEKAEKTPATNFKPDAKNIVEAVKKTATYQQVSGTQAKETTTTTRRVWRSNFFKLMFNVGYENKEIVKQHSVVSVPKDTWLVLTAAQAKTLQKKAPELEAQAKAEAAAQQATLEKEIAAAPTAAAKAKIMAAAQAEAAKMTAIKNDPVQYAKLQVTQLRQLLGIKE